METDIMLTTIDNPFDPFTEWDEWWAFDISHGHRTCEYLDRVCVTSDNLSEPVMRADIHDAMRLIIKEDPLGLYILAFPNGKRARSD